MAYLPILTYHRLLPGEPTRQKDPRRISVSASQFESHLKWLTRFGYRSIRLDHYVSRLKQGNPIARKTIGITFDDGYEEVFTLGLPLLKKYNFTAVLFVVSGELGGINRWDDGSAQLVTADQSRAWVGSGMEIGAHSVHHVHLPRVDAPTAKREITDSKTQLEGLLQQPVPLFAYPYGESSQPIEQWVQAAGFEAAFATDRASADHSVNLFALRRSVIFPSSNAWNVLWKAQPWYPAYQDRRREKK